MKKIITEYPGFKLYSIYTESVDMIPEATQDAFYRIEVPYHRDNIEMMRRKGYLFADRTIGAAINLRKNDINYQKMIRLEIRRSNDEKDKILQIAVNNFLYDSRFHVRPVVNNDQIRIIIESWVDELTETYVCIYKGQIVGFLDLEPYLNNSSFVRLAAVDGKVPGAAMSLYAHAAILVKERGCDKLYGRISSGNMAVMNLYARLGAVFSDPKDVFVRNE